MSDEASLSEQPDTSEFEAALARWQKATEEGDAEAVEEATLAMMALAMEQMANQPPDPVIQLRETANEHAAAGRVAEEEATLGELLALTAAGEIQAQHARSYQRYSEFLTRQGRHGEALEAAVTGLEIARREDMAPITAMALETVIPCLRTLSRFDEALAFADELVEISPDEPMTAVQRGRALLHQARCRLDLGQVDAAESAWKEARALLMPQSGSLFMAGVQSGLAGAADLESRLLALKGDPEGSLWALRDAVHYRRVVHSQPHVAGAATQRVLLEALRRLAEALEGAGQAGEAAAVRAEMQQLERPEPSEPL